MFLNCIQTQEGESDDFKRVLIEGNPYLLAITFCVSLLHTAFDFLAFKNDIGFWKNNKSMEGLAARSIVINAGCQVRNSDTVDIMQIMTMSPYGIGKAQLVARSMVINAGCQVRTTEQIV